MNMAEGVHYARKSDRTSDDADICEYISSLEMPQDSREKKRMPNQEFFSAWTGVEDSFQFFPEESFELTRAEKRFVTRAHEQNKSRARQHHESYHMFYLYREFEKEAYVFDDPLVPSVRGQDQCYTDDYRSQDWEHQGEFDS